MIGWVKLHRQLLNSRVFANESLLKVWIYCLLKANHDQYFAPVSSGKGEIEVEIKPGQFVFGRNKASHELGMNPNSVYKRIKKLEKLKNITIQSNNQYSVITICKWDTYQKKDKDKGQPNYQLSNNQVTSKEQLSNTYKNEKNEKNEKKNTPPNPLKGEFDEFINHFNEIFNRTGNKKFRGTKSVQRQFNARRKEGFALEEIKAAVVNLKQDDWHKKQGYANATPEYLTRPSRFEKFLIPPETHPKTDEAVKLWRETFKDPHPIVLNGSDTLHISNILNYFTEQTGDNERAIKGVKWMLKYYKEWPEHLQFPEPEKVEKHIRSILQTLKEKKKR